MNKTTLTTYVSESLRLIRNEYHISQDVFSGMIGITKKTLVQIEKERQPASWSVVVAVCMLFAESEILTMELKSDPRTVIHSIVFDSVKRPKEKTLGGKMFWKTIHEVPGFKVQQNYFSNHYRLLDGYGKRWVSSFYKDKIMAFLSDVTQEGASDEAHSL